MKNIEFTNDRLMFLLSNCIEYLYELKEREPVDEKNYFFDNIIGLNKAERKYFKV